MRGLLHSRNALFAAAGAAAVLIALGLILASVVGSDGKKTASSTTTAASITGGASVLGAAETARLFRGITQRLNVLGNPKAPVTMVEFADLQCPYCAEFAAKALPAIVREYVRPGKVKLVFAGISFIGPESETALRAGYAAGLQNRLWNFIDLMYRNQGPENSGWVTDGLVSAIAGAIPGLDVSAMLAARRTSEVDNAILATRNQASSANVKQTPTFFAGPTGGTLQHIGVSQLRPEAFRPALDALLK